MFAWICVFDLLSLFCVNIALYGQVSAMVVSSLFSCGAVVIVFAYAGLTLSYGEEDDDIFHHHIPEVVCFLSSDMKTLPYLYQINVSLCLKKFLCSVNINNFTNKQMNE